ncbi:PMD domain-containing protein [Abeliophyllum distichum]|uniref:PMD domain-containing protein n=1 Tax=Abeliophyllum distichum TaxID=126358 RepID=A0ABD1QWR5_9LAMI
MSVTQRDVGALVNLPPLGDTISHAILISSIAPKFRQKSTLTPTLACKNFTTILVMILLMQSVWLFSKFGCVGTFFVCLVSNPPWPTCPIAHELALGRSLNLCSLFLAAFYRGMAYLQHQLRTNASPTGSGPLWLAQLWLRAYFPQFGTPPMPHRSVNCYGLVINQLAPIDMSSRDVFTFFYNLNSIHSFFPFSAHQIPIYVQPPRTLNEVGAVLPVWAQYLIGRELFHDILTGTNAKAGVEVYTPQFFARQLGFGQSWPIPPYYSKNFQERFHTITKVEARAIYARNASLMLGFSLVPFNPTTVSHPFFEQFWPSVKRRLFTTNVNFAFHLLEGSGSSKTSISSTLTAIPVVSYINQTSCPLPLFPSKSSPIHTRRSVAASVQTSSPPAQTGATKGVSSCKRSTLYSSARPDDKSDDDEDVPPLTRRKRSSTSPLEDFSSPIPSIPPPSGPSNEAILREEVNEGLRTSIAENVEPIGDSSSFQGVFPPSMESEGITTPVPVVQEPPLPIRDDSSQIVKSPSDVLLPSSSKITGESAHEDADTILRSIQDNKLRLIRLLIPLRPVALLLRLLRFL